MIKWSSLTSRGLWPYLFILGAILACTGLLRAYNIFACQSWPVTQGKILTSDIERGYLREGVATPRVKITYEYRIGQSIYTGHRVAFGKSAGRGNTVRRLLDVYRAQTPVMVHFNPGDPAKAVLETTVSWKSFEPMIWGVPLTVISILGYRRRWELTSEDWFDRKFSDKMSRMHYLLGVVSALILLSIPFMWWAIIKSYAGR